MSPSIASAKRVAFQGEPGSFSQAAAREALPKAEAVPKPNFEETVDAVKSGETDLAIIPVENSLHGRIADIHHLLPEAGLFIVGEHFLRIHMQLLGIKGAQISDLKEVFSQVPALGQCRKIIRELKLEAKPWHDTSGAARHVAKIGDKKLAAIASSLAGEIHGLETLRADIEDENHNMTRFLIMARQPDLARPENGKSITSFVFQVKNIPAALYKAMGGFASNGVNMTKLESYQLGGSFNATQFYADIEGHPEDVPVKLAFEELEFFTTRVTMLGTYPAHPFRQQLP